MFLHLNVKGEMERSIELVTQGHSTATEKKRPTSSAMNGSSGKTWRGDNFMMESGCRIKKFPSCLSLNLFGCVRFLY